MHWLQALKKQGAIFKDLAGKHLTGEFMVVGTAKPMGGIKDGRIQNNPSRTRPS